ncbi:hypothetical protein D1B31_01205 [Neobacillus notoginsengisoli]|uniref:Uncharacterized protein n=2 Tax=Neobacillus notoginsengisoli TaxID=1578198 RepID=A0A417YZX7_9BACI|nr:hypothetical protein [Neobacillus notoginsengisoli]RHW43316.1 hypothetical protein D1B31_01205 [Neobacillus notoginsengisoli]
MLATESILKTWEKFNAFPMETLTKAWFFRKGTDKKQRDVSLMREHREQYGMSGNCFDLALWLLDEFKKDGVEAYPAGSDLDSEDAHVAVVAINENGHRYLCDLGDQWITPILIDTYSEEYTNEKLRGFFPGAEVQVRDHEMGIEIVYHRPNGKVSKQIYHTNPIEMNDFLMAAEFCQNLIHPIPLVECRVPYKSETAHWEFYNWESFLSTSEGLMMEAKIEKVEDWADRIYQKTGYNKEILMDVLLKYKRNQ